VRRFTKCKTFSGSGFVVINQIINSALYNALLLSGSYFHYAPDAAYLKINPMVQLSIREHSGQQKQSILFHK
jgi:hypothetical protein